VPAITLAIDEINNRTDFLLNKMTVYKDTTYGMLTRVGPVNFQTLSLMFGKILNHYKWNRLKLLYESSGQDYIRK
ncbi:uncharacterized protein LOC126815201, partial [Patella vulgata]|uniref:uncharacterized protein LOC126815201 n=1 Tax=Patella vulgata TaxID=6465 RepID=UPI002180738A